MKNKVIAVLALALAGLSAGAISALAQDVQIGYIDSIKIFAENKATQEAEQLYRRDVEQWEAQKTRLEQEIVRMGEELAAQSPMLSEEKKAERTLELNRKRDEYKRFMEETFGDAGLAARRNKELTQPIVDRINRIIEEIAKEKRLKMVFDVANANIVYADKTLDLTDLVLAQLGQQ